MAKVKITGHASGTGVVTVTAPNTSTDRTITLPDATGTLLNSDGSGANLTSLPADATKLPLAGGTMTGDLIVSGASTPKLTVKSGDGTSASIKFQRINENDTSTDYEIKNDGGAFKIIGDNNSQNEYIIQQIDNSTQRFNTGNVERMRIDSSGNVLVGTTTQPIYNGSTTSGTVINYSGRTDFARAGTLAVFNRLTTDGEMLDFRKNGTPIGSISAVTNALRLESSRPELLFSIPSANQYFGAGVGLSPSTADDNELDLGRSSARYDDIYATNGTIQTSDRNEKQDIEALTDAETAVATACKGLMRKFRWKDAVAEKGDDARIHFGIIAQDLQDAFTAEGLDAGRYAMFISTTWYEKLVPVDAVIAVEAVDATYDDEGTELTPAVEAVEAKDAYTRTDTEDAPTEGYTERTRLGVRYPELLAFIISAI